MLMSILLWTLALLLVAVGVAGTILPGLPGTVLVLAGLVLAAGIDGFSRGRHQLQRWSCWLASPCCASLGGRRYSSARIGLGGQGDRAPAHGPPPGPGWVRWWDSFFGIVGVLVGGPLPGGRAG